MKTKCYLVYKVWCDNIVEIHVVYVVYSVRCILFVVHRVCGETYFHMTLFLIIIYMLIFESLNERKIEKSAMNNGVNNKLKSIIVKLVAAV